MRTRVAWALRYVTKVRNACAAEGLDNEVVAREWDGRSRKGGRVHETGHRRGARRAWAKL
jgi:hypothetical protein